MSNQVTRELSTEISQNTLASLFANARSTAEELTKPDALQALAECTLGAWNVVKEAHATAQQLERAGVPALSERRCTRLIAAMGCFEAPMRKIEARSAAYLEARGACGEQILSMMRNTGEEPHQIITRALRDKTTAANVSAAAQIMRDSAETVQLVLTTLSNFIPTKDSNGVCVRERQRLAPLRDRLAVIRDQFTEHGFLKATAKESMTSGRIAFRATAVLGFLTGIALKVRRFLKSCGFGGGDAPTTPTAAPTPVRPKNRHTRPRLPDPQPRTVAPGRGASATAILHVPQSTSTASISASTNQTETITSPEPTVVDTLIYQYRAATGRSRNLFDTIIAEEPARTALDQITRNLGRFHWSDGRWTGAINHALTQGGGTTLENENARVVEEVCALLREYIELTHFERSQFIGTTQ